MGLLRELVLLPLAPVRGVAWTLEQVADAADREHQQRIRRELAELYRAHETGEISEEEFDRREDELLDRLGNRPLT